MAAAGVWLGAYLTGQDYSAVVIYIASLIGALVCAVGNIFNDISDIEIDRINHPQRPLPAGEISVPVATTAATLFAFISLTVSIITSGILALAAAISLLLLTLYNLWLKKLPLVGNLTVALLGSFPVALGAFLVAPKSLSIVPGPIIAVGFAFLVHLTREIVKDLADWKGDISASYKTLPLYLNSKSVSLIAAALMIVTALLVLIIVTLEWYSRYFSYAAGFLVLPLLLSLTASLMIKQDIDRYRVTASALKLVMVTGMIAFLVG